MIFISVPLIVIGVIFVFLGGKFFLDEVVSAPRPLITFASPHIAYFSSMYYMAIGCICFLGAVLLS